MLRLQLRRRRWKTQSDCKIQDDGCRQLVILKTDEISLLVWWNFYDSDQKHAQWRRNTPSNKFQDAGCRGLGYRKTDAISLLFHPSIFTKIGGIIMNSISNTHRLSDVSKKHRNLNSRWKSPPSWFPKIWYRFFTMWSISTNQTTSIMNTFKSSNNAQQAQFKIVDGAILKFEKWFIRSIFNSLLTWYGYDFDIAHQFVAAKTANLYAK